MIINTIRKSKPCTLQKEEIPITIHLIYNLVEINLMDTSINNQNMYIIQYAKCAVDYYDVAMPKYSQKGYSTPVRKLKQSPKRINSYHFHSHPKPTCQILKFEGYISRESPFRNWIGNMKEQSASRVSQIQRIHNQVKIIEKNQKSESYQLQEYLNAVNDRIQWNSLPKVFNYQRCQTPDILKGARERVKRF
ncbi:unnamed protein product [Paramecium octaurelia]|uniref:Uncharacterized protein n=1 Tax=Paramecium octaurelia TaxID=43137 RepID=A0A8S1SGC2_PAROT|nr:unnamed protein product [Paramecium octaurelia]